MATEERYASSHLAGDFSDPANANGPADGTFTTDTSNASPTSRWAMGDPSGGITGTQTVTIKCQKDASGGNGDPTIACNLYENGASVGSIFGATSVTDATTTIQGTFDASSITNPNDVEIELVVSGQGGQPAGRRTVQVDSINWTVNLAGASPVNITLAPATLTAAAQPLNLSLTAHSHALVAASLTATAQPLGASPSPLSVALNPATLTATAQALNLSLGALTVALSPATLTAVAQALGVDVAGSPVTVEMVPATASLVAQSLDVSRAATSIQLSPATITVGAQSLDLSLTALTVALSPATITVAAQPLGVSVAGGGDPFDTLRVAQVNMVGVW